MVKKINPWKQASEKVASTLTGAAKQKYRKEQKAIRMAAVNRAKAVKPSGDHVKKSKAEKDAFYASWDWRTARMVALQKHGRRCQCCGATPLHVDPRGQLVRIVVDHIISIGTDWSRRLDPDNHQVLCDECNMGKGNWDTTDYR